MTDEEWRPVVGHPGYEVSDHGRVRNRSTGRVQSPKPHPKSGRIKATFGRGAGKRESVQRVVLRAFVGEPPPGYEASHLNGACTDNRLANLAWEDHLTNMRRKHEHGTVIKGERVNTAKLTEDGVREIRALAATGLAQRPLARMFGVDQTAISAIVRRKSWKHVA